MLQYSPFPSEHVEPVIWTWNFAHGRRTRCINPLGCIYNWLQGGIFHHVWQSGRGVGFLGSRDRKLRGLIVFTDFDIQPFFHGHHTLGDFTAVFI